MNFFEAEWERPEFDSVPSLAQNMVYLLRECDDFLVRKTLQEAYRDFCKRSAALRTWRRVEIESDINTFMVAPILSGEIDCVTQVRWDGTLSPIRGWCCVGHPPMLSLPSLSAHDFFFGSRAPVPQERPDVGSFEPPRPPIPIDGEPPAPLRGVPRGILIEAVEIPHLNEERAPKLFLQRYGDALVDGALVRLFSMTNRPWSDPEQARQRGIAYSNTLSEARQRGMCGGHTANAGSGFALDMSSMV